jgi:hypothetical protein
MPIPTTLADLDPVAGNNFPLGSEAITPNLDDFLRAHAAFIAQVRDLLTAETAARTAALNAMWPVGSIYINASSAANPATFLPGTWTQLTSGFLYPQGSPSSGAAGATGGEVNHTLSPAEMPWHQHAGTTSWNGDHAHSYSYEGVYPTGYGLEGGNGSVVGKSGTTSTNGGHNHTFTTDPAGGGAAHNNMPPYHTVYMFKRTA